MTTAHDTTFRPLPGGDPDRLSAWWWLVLPLAVGLALSLLGRWAPDFYALWIGSEARGLLELSHVALPLAGAVLALRMLRRRALRGRRGLAAWIALAGLCCLYVAGEEASWGQHYLGWETPPAWQAVNDQGETNLHNMSSWLDQKPRLLLELGVVLGGILLPLLALRRPALRRGRLAVVLPPLFCLPTALLAELSRLPERIAPLLGREPGLFPRASEVQELYFYLFVLLYLVALGRRLSAGTG